MWLEQYVNLMFLCNWENGFNNRSLCKIEWNILVQHVSVLSFTKSLSSNPCFADSCVPYSNSLLFCAACLDWSTVTQKNTTSISSYVLNGLEHHSCSLWQRHAVHAEAFSWTVMKMKNWKIAFTKSNKFSLCHLNTDILLVSVALYGHVPRTVRNKQTKLPGHLHCMGDVSIFRESTTARCQWLADRQTGWGCLPCRAVASVFPLSVMKCAEAGLMITAKQNPSQGWKKYNRGASHI